MNDELNLPAEPGSLVVELVEELDVRSEEPVAEQVESDRNKDETRV